MSKMRIKSDDKVRIIAGKEKGKEGTDLFTEPKKERVTVDGINIAKKAMRPTQANPQGGIITMPAPINISNVMLVCPSCKKPTRVNVVRTDGKKLRKCKKCEKTFK